MVRVRETVLAPLGKCQRIVTRTPLPCATRSNCERVDAQRFVPKKPRFPSAYRTNGTGKSAVSSTPGSDLGASGRSVECSKAR